MQIVIPKEELVLQAISIYDKINYLDRGGYKIVYIGEKSQVKEAVKLIHLPKEELHEIGEDELTLLQRRISREIELIKKCKSPYIVKIGELPFRELIIEKEHYLAYSEEYLDGKNLHNLIRQRYIPDETELRILAENMIDAIDELWSNENSVHRDIKPLNIMKLDNTERMFVLFDLGLAFILNSTPLTKNPFDIPGTRYYLAPEMLNPNFREKLDFRSDLYALGVTIYEYASGTNPFMASEFEHDIITLSRILREVPNPLINKRPDLSQEFCDLIDQWMKKQPHLRPSNLKMLRNKLRNG